jgi:hypothetical protein
MTEEQKKILEFDPVPEYSDKEEAWYREADAKYVPTQVWLLSVKCGNDHTCKIPLVGVSLDTVQKVKAVFDSEACGICGSRLTATIES